MRNIFLICFVLCIFSVHAQSSLKKIPYGVFVPKGQWIVGSSVSYSEHTETNYDFLVVEKLNADGYNFKVSPLVSYAFKDNMAAGIRLSYGRTLAQMDETEINLGGSSDNFEISNLYQLKHSFSAMAIFRNYIPLGNSKRFALFSEAQLEVGGSESKAANGYGEELTGTFSRSTDMSFGVSPGLVAFINNYTAVEVSVGVLGINFSKKTQTTNQVETGEQSSASANFRINLFSIGLGIAFYL